MIDSDAARLRELTKMMASENDPPRLKLLAEELKTIISKQSATKVAEDGSKPY